MKKNLILGDGLLGKTLHKKTGWDYISRKKDGIDFNRPETYHQFLLGYDTIINCIGYTKTYDMDFQKHWNTNFVSVFRLAYFCKINFKKLVHISTDYIYSETNEYAKETDVPVHCANWYGYTKLLSDGMIQIVPDDYLLIRTSFKKRPFTHPYAVIQDGNFDYVDKIAELIIKLIEKDATGVFNVGTTAKSMFELAEKTKPNVGITEKPIHPTMPRNITMDTTKMKKFLR